jgi:hypothetical protein
MPASAWVLACAFELLGGTAGQLPPVHIVARAPRGVSANADGFADHGARVIYLVASAPAFRLAESAQKIYPGQCAERQALKMVASVIAHEAWHVQNGRDEKGAYEAQLGALNRMGMGPGSALNRTVTRAMRSVLEAQRRKHSENVIATR